MLCALPGMAEHLKHTVVGQGLSKLCLMTLVLLSFSTWNPLLYKDVCSEPCKLGYIPPKHTLIHPK